MSLVEVDETELANLRRVASVAETVGKHPKARALLQEAVALAAPEQAGPETRLRSEFSEGFQAIRDELKAFREESQKERDERVAKESEAALQRRWQEGRAALRARGYANDGVDAIEKLMEDEGIARHETAADLFEKRNPPPEPVMTGSQHWNWFKSQDGSDSEVDIKRLLDQDYDGFLAQAIPNALKAAREGR